MRSEGATRLSVLLLLAAFACSGASGLIYQIVWVRLLSLTFGVTIYAVSVVVAAFMGGLSLGSYAGGRLADRVSRPIVWYAAAEVCIAAMGLLSPRALSWVQTAYVALFPPEGSELGPAVVGLRFAVASLVLVIPTTLMGATLPLIVKGVAGTQDGVAGPVSWLYGTNSAGAIVGTLGAGFILIGTLGIAGTITAAAGLNALAVALAMSAPLALAKIGDRPRRPEGSPGSRGGALSPRIVRLVMLTFALQGLASLAYEVVWFRVLAILLDGSSYAFAIVLATVLLGIAVGSWLAGLVVDRPWPWLRIYSWIQTGVAAVAFLALIVVAYVYPLADAAALVPLLRSLVASHFGWMALVGAAALTPPMVLLGASFPVAARLVVVGSTPGARLGALYAGNTAAAILGTWIAGFVLIPLLGGQRSVEVIAILNAALGLILAVVSGPGARRAIAIAVFVPVASAVAVAVFAPRMFDSIAQGRFPGGEVVWFGEGRETSVTVVREQPSGFLQMYLNDQSQASDDPAVAGFHQLLGHLPMLVHPDPQDVLIVGLGGGATAGALSRHHPRRMDVVELSETVVEAAAAFAHVNASVLSFPNLSLRIDDGRNYLLLTDRRYDVITADVINPRNAGSANVYSYEYFSLVRKVLKPGGLMAQWLEDNPNNPDNDAQRRLMARTFTRAFPHVTLWASGALMIGSEMPLGRDSLQELERRPASLGVSGLGTVAGIAAQYTLGDAELRAWAGDGPIVTDDRPYNEYFFSLPGGTRVTRWRDALR